MAELFFSRSTTVFCLLVAATLLTWNFGHGWPFESVFAASVAILLISFLKVGLVMQEFMEVRSAPLALKATTYGWAVTILVILVALYGGLEPS